MINVQDFESTIRSRHPELSSEEQQLQIDKAGEDISNHLRETFQNFQDNLVAYFGNDQFALLKGIGGDSPTTLNTIRFMTEKADFAFESLQKIQQKFVYTLGVGQFYPDLGGLRKSYQDARLALEVGSRVWGPNQVYHIKRVGMFITLANTSQERKAELAHQILSPLLRDEQLYKTVQSFLGSGLNLTDAAERLCAASGHGRHIGDHLSQSQPFGLRDKVGAVGAIADQRRRHGPAGAMQLRDGVDQDIDALDRPQRAEVLLDAAQFEE